MKLRQLFFIVGLFLYTHSYGQVYEFIVCGTRGVNSVKTGGEWKLLKTSETLDHFEEIRTSGDNCYLGLLHSSGRSVVIRKPGTYIASDLLKEVNTGSTAVASKYADFVFTKMTTVSPGNSTGKIRSVGDKSISVYLPASSQVFGKEETIRWEGVAAGSQYKVIVRNMFDDVISEYTADINRIAINLNDQALKDQNAIFIRVELSGDPATHSATYGITRLSGEDYNTIEKNYNQLISELYVDSPINNLIISSFFEDNNLLLDAGTYFQKFIDSSPGVNDLEKMYQVFLARNGLK